MTKEQKEIRRQRALEWNKTHPERVKQNSRLRYAKKKDELLEKARAYRHKHLKENKERCRAFHVKYPWYNAWQSAKQRCTNLKHIRFHRYGGRGIKFFLSKGDMAFMWARDRASELCIASLDRIDNDGDYRLENCRFIEMVDNARKRTYDHGAPQFVEAIPAHHR